MKLYEFNEKARQRIANLLPTHVAQPQQARSGAGFGLAYCIYALRFDYHDVDDEAATKRMFLVLHGTLKHSKVGSVVERYDLIACSWKHFTIVNKNSHTVLSKFATH